MVTGLEIIPLVFGLISLYNNAEAIFERHRAKRKEKIAATSAQTDEAEGLKRSLQAAPAEILRETKRGVETVGEDAFGTGDDEAISKLSELHDRLKKSLVTRLLEIKKPGGDQLEELEGLRRVADDVRDEAVVALMLLRRRLDNEQAEDLTRAPEHELSDIGTNLSRKNSMQDTLSTKHKKTDRQDHGQRSNDSALQSSWRQASDDSGPNRSKSIPVSSSSEAPHKGSGKKRLNQSSKGRADIETRKGPDPLALISGARRSSSVVTTAPTESFAEPYIRPAQTGKDHELSFREMRRGSAQHVPSTQQAVSRRATVPAISATHRASIASFQDLQRSVVENASLPTTALYNVPDPTSVPQPSSENDYLGLCKGAVKLWRGDRSAFTAGPDYAQWTPQPKLSTMHCSTSVCTFKHTCQPSELWNTVIVDKARGLKYRWSFLAKSHVEHSRPAQQGQYLYQCLFCTFLQYPRRRMKKLEYLDHVDLEHRGSTALHSLILYNTCCVSDHECTAEDPFDINLFPLTPEEMTERRKLNLRKSISGTADEFASAFQWLR